MASQNAAVILLNRNLVQHPDKTAYICGDEALSYRDLQRSSERFAKLLQESGIRPADRVLIALPDGFAFPAAFLGCLLAGAVGVVVSNALRAEDYAHIVTDSGAQLLVTDQAGTIPLSAAANIKTITCSSGGVFPAPSGTASGFVPFEPSADDLSHMLYSSGSTGKPKGIPHRHSDLIIPCETMGADVLGITSNDVIFSPSKFSFAYGLFNSLVFPLYFGASAIITPGKPDAAVILDLIQRHTPSIFFSVPTIYSQIILSCTAEKLQLPMRLCYSAGEALPAVILEEWQRLTGIELLDGIGSTETSYVYISNRPGNIRPGSNGQAVEGYTVKLVDDNDMEVAAGSEGNLLVKGATITPFYWNLPEKSASTILPDGYLRTGDVMLERDGFYYHCGRSDDMIKAGGQWVSPLPVENSLLSHPAVAECAVAAISAAGLTKPGAFIVLAPEFTGSNNLIRELRKYLLQQLPDYMCPARFKFVDSLPRTSTGKIQRFLLRDQ